jgi:hypothetical protein
VQVFVLEVADRKHLARVMRVVRHMPDVLRTVRTISTHAHAREQADEDKFEDN